MSDLVVSDGSLVRHGEESFRLSTNAASLCSEIVKRTAVTIQGRRFVSVEGWQSIAVAHGCVASSGDVEVVPGGVRAIGYVRRMVDGMVLAQAEGFVGEDEVGWFGGTDSRGKWYPARPMYAIRAMAQTRAISRACRSAFAHVVVLIDADLSTTPAEEAIPTENVGEVATRNEPISTRGDAGASAPRTKALRRLFAVMREANLIDEDKTRNKQNVIRLANRYLQTERPVATMDDLAVNDIHDLASCIADDTEMARQIIQEGD